MAEVVQVADRIGQLKQWSRSKVIEQAILTYAGVLNINGKKRDIPK